MAVGWSAMVVEDHEFERHLAVRLLRELGAGEVLEGRHGRDALNQLLGREAPVDLVVSDLDMPEMDGVEFLGHLALNRLAKAVLVVSGMDSKVQVAAAALARAYGLRVLGTLSKPLSLDRVAGRLEGLHRPEEAAATAPEDLGPAIDGGLGRGEFLAFGMPRLPVAGGAPTGVQVLARWFRPDAGLVPPAGFLEPMGQEGRWERLLVSQMEELAQLPPDPGLAYSLKLPAQALSDPRAADRLAQRAADLGIPAARLILDLDDPGSGDPAAEALSTLSRLRLKGFGLSLRGGTEGTPFLDALFRLPFTELRVEAGLLRDARSVPWSRALLETSLEAARRLGMRTVADRIETEADLEQARALGFDAVQGFLLGRPQPLQRLVRPERRD
ncbi:MAG: EAL domain-containing response regulator [Holophagaceae bacterium]